MGLGHGIAMTADQEGRGVILPRAGAGDEGIEALDLVGKAVADQKIQRPISHRRLRAKPIAAQVIKHVIRPHGAVLMQKNFQCPAAHRGKLQLLRGARFGNRLKPGFDAGVVIVGFKGDVVHWWACLLFRG